MKRERSEAEIIHAIIEELIEEIGQSRPKDLLNQYRISLEKIAGESEKLKEARKVDTEFIHEAITV
jgi:hypothetical protein